MIHDSFFSDRRQGSFERDLTAAGRRRLTHISSQINANIDNCLLLIVNSKATASLLQERNPRGFDLIPRLNAHQIYACTAVFKGDAETVEALCKTKIRQLHHPLAQNVEDLYAPFHGSG